MQQLEEKDFIRQRLYSDKRPQYKKYADLVIGDTSIPKILKYELITSLFGPLSGALGLMTRKYFYPKLFANIGKNVVFGNHLIIRHPDKISIGNNVIIDDYSVIDGRGSGEDGLIIGDNTIIGKNVTIQSKSGSISIGDNCNIGAYTVISAQGGVTIENWVQIAGGCKLSGGLFKYNSTIEDGFPFTRYSKGPIVIEEKCFFGGAVCVTDGVRIGKCSMIGTGSTVTENVPEYSVYMPRPGMVIGKTLKDSAE